MKKPSLATIEEAERDDWRWESVKRVEAATMMRENLRALLPHHRMLAVAWQMADLTPKDQLAVIKFFGLVKKRTDL